MYLVEGLVNSNPSTGGEGRDHLLEISQLPETHADAVVLRRAIFLISIHTHFNRVVDQAMGEHCSNERDASLFQRPVLSPAPLGLPPARETRDEEENSLEQERMALTAILLSFMEF
jgi:hypothetical protein